MVGLGSSSSESSTEILTSGFIEAKDVAVALEVGGRITEISVDEGDTVAAGMLLVKADDTLLKAQIAQAEANVLLAQTSLEQSIASRNEAKIAWEQALDIQSRPLELDPQVIAAAGILEQADLKVVKVKGMDSVYNLALAQAQVDNARDKVDNFKKAETVVGRGSSYDRIASTLLAEGVLAQAELNLDYQTKLQDWNLSSAEMSRDNAQKALESLLASNDFAVERGETAYQTAETAVAVARQQLEQARTTLEVHKVQLDRLTVDAAITGVVAGRYAEVGEITPPGAPVLTLVELQEVTLVAYVPESKIGKVILGSQAIVSVDSYPEEGFTGEVVYISPQAAFTPRNVQLKEEREKMVFAVKIRLDNPEQKLKPGMPADARIVINQKS
ncbi:HlyD family secretion protein [Chloroflexota bacterium]